MIRNKLLALGVVGCLALTACGDDGDSATGNGDNTKSNEAAPQGFTPPDLKALDKLGTPEGALNIVAWAGYAEDGSNDPAIDWVKPFTEKTGCKVNVKLGNTSD